MTELEEQLYAKGIEAKVLLENPLVTEAFNDIASALKEAMANTNPLDREKREAYYYQHRGLLELLNLLTSYVHAKEQLDAQQEQEDDLFIDDLFDVSEPNTLEE